MKLRAALQRRFTRGGGADLCDEELGDPLRQFAFLAGQDHLQHVAVQLLHDDKHPLWGLEHTLQVDDAGVVQILRTETDVSWM